MRVNTLVVNERFFYIQAAKLAGLAVLACLFSGFAIHETIDLHDWQRVFLYLNVAYTAWVIVRMVEWAKVLYNLWRMWSHVNRLIQIETMMRMVAEAIEKGEITKDGKCNCPNCRAERGEQ